MSLGSLENGESGEPHPLYASLKQRCLVLVDENGNALDSDRPMRMEGPPDLAVVHAVDEDSCRQFMEQVTTSLPIFQDEKKRFMCADPALLTGGASANLVIVERPEPVHIFALTTAHRNAHMLGNNIGLTFARFQAPQVEDGEYERCKDFCAKGKLPRYGTLARTILDRVALMRDHHGLTGYNDQNADHILYTGGDFPKPGAYRDMEHLANEGRIEIIKPHQLVYGLQTGVFIMATDKLREERPLDVADYIRERVDWLSFRERDTVSQDVFYFNTSKAERKL